jgi:NADH-quinone oxidoreductase subunit H
VAVTLFWGGWLRPFPNVAWLALPLDYGVPVVLFGASGLLCFYLAPRQVMRWQRIFMVVVGVSLLGVALLFAIPAVNRLAIGVFWFVLKVAVIVYMMIWFRGTFPRFRYDQLMNIGWKVLIPLGMVFVLVNAVVGMYAR